MLAPAVSSVELDGKNSSSGRVGTQNTQNTQNSFKKEKIKSMKFEQVDNAIYLFAQMEA